jgi:hypothetical protein
MFILDLPTEVLSLILEYNMIPYCKRVCKELNDIEDDLFNHRKNICSINYRTRDVFVDIDKMLYRDDRESIMFSFRYLECYCNTWNIGPILRSYNKTTCKNMLSRLIKNMYVYDICRSVINNYNEEMFSYLLALIPIYQYPTILMNCIHYKVYKAAIYMMHNYDIKESDISERYIEEYRRLLDQ